MAAASKSKPTPMNVLPQQKLFPMRWLLGPALLLAIAFGCASPQIGGPEAPRQDPAAGVLTLPSGRSVRVYPVQLAYTGVASYRWPDGREYQGNWVAGLPEGIGSEQLPSGEHYRGTWHNGLRDGHGELISAAGSRYVGDFAAGKRQGDGSESSSSGIYNGEWEQDLPGGTGEFFSSNGAWYKGDWQNGVRDGRGSYNDGQNNTYEGDWTQDTPNGFGRMANADGTVYQGELRNGQRDGYGLLEAGGFSYEGTWRGGKRHGYGQSTTPDGGSFIGSFQNDNRHGPGRASNADGSYHDGEWVEDQPFGPGTRVDASGIEISGNWSQDLVTSGMVVFPDGSSYAGKLMSRNFTVAPAFVSWLEAAATTGNPYAQLWLARVLSNYLEPPPDPQRARMLLLAAAAQGLAEAAYQAAQILPAETDPTERIRLLTQAAAAGHSGASAQLGGYYATGTDVARDTSVAVTYFTQASDGGNLAARNNLAWILATYPDAMIRDGKQALALIQPLASLYENWRHLDTLAAAYAELGQFEQATQTQQLALKLASARQAEGDAISATQLQNMRARLDLYQQGQRFRESTVTFE